MKKIIALIIMLCIAGTSTAYAHGSRSGKYGGYSRDYYERPYHRERSYPRERSYSRSRHNDGLGIAIGVVGGLLLGSALASAAAPPPAVVYEPPRQYYQPRICVQEQVISGEWQISSYDGRQVYVQYPYPVTRRVQVPCY